MNSKCRPTVRFGARFKDPIRALLLTTVALFVGGCSGFDGSEAAMPEGFVDLSVFMASQGLSLETEVRYFGSDNFVGTRIDGYEAGKVILSREAASALLQVQRSFEEQGLALKVFDGYRPQQAVDHFVRWARDVSDTRMKAVYYPNVDKEDLFSKGYIASRSGHSRGSTLDLTLVTLADKVELDMGSNWDFFDPLSWPSSKGVNEQQYANRQLLRDAMMSAGFRPLKEEWWHFTLDQEPYPDSYFDFVIQ